MSRKVGVPPPLVLETVEKIRKLRDAWLADDRRTVLQTAPSLLQGTGANLPEDIQIAVYRIYTDALLEESQFERVLQIVSESSSNNNNNKKVTKQNAVQQQALSLPHMYALYRLERYTEAYDLAAQTLETLHSDGNHEDDKATTTVKPVLQHLMAQCLYRMGRVKASRQIYETLPWKNDAQVATNLVATYIANATPFVALSPNVAEWEPAVNDLLLEGTKTGSVDGESHTAYPYDLAYNVATWKILTGQDNVHHAVHQLEQALRHAQAQTADGSEGDQQEETAALRANLDWARVFWQGGSTDTAAIPMKYLTASGKMVALVNRAIDMVPPKDGLRLLPLDSNSGNNSNASRFNPMQARILVYNRAILQYKANQWDECVETCRHLISSLSSSSSKPQKDTNGNNTSSSNNNASSSTVSPDSKVEALWWETRATVLQVRAQLQKGGKYNHATAEHTLQSLMQMLQKQPDSNVRDHAVAYLLCHQDSILAGEGKDDRFTTSRLELLQSLPPAWQTQRAVVASMAALYQQQGQTEKAVELVQATGHQDALADLLLSQGEYAQAVQLYESADLTDPIAQARYSRALTYCDPAKAVAYWNKIRPSQVLDGSTQTASQAAVVLVDGAELEQRPVPRLRAMVPHRSTEAPVQDAGADTSNNKRSHEAVLRRRAKKREAYLAELERRGLPRSAQPDPERWLPKYERSYNRRRRNKGGPHRGAQGGISDKDAAKLDVAARQEARAAGEPVSSTSTAHIAAVLSGGPRKGGRRR